MKNIFCRHVIGVFALSLLLAGAASAQQAEDRAGELKSWREQCNDPDPDLRLAYVEKAVASGDAAVQRICIRLALESDNADIRNLGLRAAVAMQQQIRFDVAIPPQLAAALKSASGSEKKMAEIDRWYVMRSWRTMENGLVFAIDGAEVGSSSSVWFPLAGLSDSSNNYKGKATIVGTTLNWLGRVNLTPDVCTLDAQLKAGAELAGMFHCGDNWSFPVSARLL